MGDRPGQRGSGGEEGHAWVQTACMRVGHAAPGVNKRETEGRGRDSGLRDLSQWEISRRVRV